MEFVLFRLFINFLPIVMVFSFIGFFLYPSIDMMLEYSIWEKINPNNTEYNIHPSYYFYIITSFILLGFTILQSFFPNSHWLFKIFTGALFIFFTIPLYVSQSIFVVDDNVNEKSQNKNIKQNEDKLFEVDNKLAELSKIINEEKKFKKELLKTKNSSMSLNQEIDQLNAEINQLNTEIFQLNLEIYELIKRTSKN